MLVHSRSRRRSRKFPTAVLGHDKPPSEARRAPSLLWRQRNLPDEKLPHYLTLLDPPRDITEREEGEAELSPLRCLLFGSSTCTRECAACWPSFKTGQRAHQSPREPRFVRAKPVADQRNRCTSIPPPLPSPPPSAAISPISPRREEEEFIVPKRWLIFVSRQKSEL